jgi:hypothetical protein
MGGMMKHILISALALSFVAGPVAAHSPYMKPNVFAADTRNHVVVEASFAEGDFRPEVAIAATGWNVTGPDGKVIALTPAATLKAATYLEVPVSAKGSYRISSGERVGRVAKAAEKGGDLRFLEGAHTELHEGETLVEVQSLTRSDVYVSKGEPTPIAPVGTGVEFQPLTPANSLYVGEPVRMVVLRDGQPFAGAPVTLMQDGAVYTETGLPDIEMVADDRGEVTFTPQRAGLYLIQTRIRWATATDKWSSFTATTTFEILP